MRPPSVRRDLGIVTSAMAVVILLSACTSAGAPGTGTADPSATNLPSPTVTRETLQPGIDIGQVSASDPSAAAKAVFAKCHIGEMDMVPLDNVTGMGLIEAAKDLEHYVPLTGREPQLNESGPAWIVTVRYDLPQPGSTELWTDPTCVVTDQEAGWFATGPVTDTATGKVTQPEAPIHPPDRVVPPLAP